MPTEAVMRAMAIAERTRLIDELEQQVSLYTPWFVPTPAWAEIRGRLEKTSLHVLRQIVAQAAVQEAVESAIKRACQTPPPKCRLCGTNDAGGFFEMTVCGPCWNNNERNVRNEGRR